MNQSNQIRFLRKPEVLDKTGLSKSTLHLRIAEGLFCPPIPLGGRAVGFVNHEVDAVLSALLAGHSTDQIKVLVVSLVEQRKLVA